MQSVAFSWKFPIGKLQGNWPARADVDKKRQRRWRELRPRSKIGKEDRKVLFEGRGEDLHWPFR